MMPGGTQNDLDILRQLYESAKARGPVQDADAAAAVDYDFNSPYRYEPPQLEALARLAGRAAQSVGQALAAVLNGAVELSAKPVTQHFRAGLAGQPAEGQYFLAVTRGGQGCGYLRIRAALALEYVSRLLGGSASGDQRQLSELESSLLLDVCGAAVKGFWTGLGGSGESPKLAAAVEAKPPLPAEQNDEFCSFTLGGKAEGQELALVIPSGLVDGLVGLSAAKPQANAREDLAGNLQEVSVDLTVWLGRAELALRDLPGLAAGDVLLLQQTPGQPAEALLQGQPVLAGLPVSCQGNYAVQVAECVSADGAK